MIGFVSLVLHCSIWAVSDFCYLEDLCVATSIRDSGVGKLLIEWGRRWSGNGGVWGWVLAYPEEQQAGAAIV